MTQANPPVLQQDDTPVAVNPRRLSQRALKTWLDTLVLAHKTEAYIGADPIQFPHRYRNDPRACELVAFLAALFSYGRRDLIIRSVSSVLSRMDDDPLGFIGQFDARRDARVFDGFVYRFNKAPDLVFLCQRLRWAYAEFETLENLFIDARGTATNLKTGMGRFIDRLSGLPAAETSLPSYGLKFLLAHPMHGGACKRMNMFLRWVVRRDEAHRPQVDLGLWRRALRPGELLIPLDTHVTQMNRYLGLSDRHSNTWETAEAITRRLRRFCPDDPIRYDFALMGLSLTGAHKAPRLRGARNAKPV